MHRTPRIPRQTYSAEVTGWRMTYDWTIENFTLLPQQKGVSIDSPFFYAGPDKEMWWIDFYPRGEDEETGDCVSLFLNLQSSDKLGITVQVEFSILKSNQIIAQNVFKKKFDYLTGEGFDRFARRSELTNTAETDTFIIRCKMDIITPSIDEPFNPYKTQLSEDLRLLFKQPKFSDFNIIVGSEKFQAHKSVLAVRSPVFAIMFEHEQMAENIKNEMTIEDTEPVVVKAMLEFLYTGQVEDLDPLASRLLAAANKYEVIGLRNMCAGSLKTGINIENAIDIFKLADLYNMADLKQKAMEFVKSDFSEVSKTEAFKELEDAVLLKELMCFVALPKKLNV